MSRFLARALARVRAEADSIARPAPGAGPAGLPPADVQAAPDAPRAPVVPLDASAWPDGEAPPPWCHPGPIVPLHRLGGVVTPDLWLNRLAGNLARVMAEGATARPCPSGGLDLERQCGRRVSFSAEVVREMRVAGLLPASLAGGGAFISGGRGPQPDEGLPAQQSISATFSGET